MSKLILILIFGSCLDFAVSTHSRLKREDAQDFQELSRAISTLSGNFETKMAELKTELMETKSQLQSKLEEIKQTLPTEKLTNLQESITNLSVKEDKISLKLEKLDVNLNSCNAMIISVGKRMTSIINQGHNSTQSEPEPLPKPTTPSPNIPAEEKVLSPLSVEKVGVKLPFKNAAPSPIYDGDDAIYLLGGVVEETETKILKFSISSETIEKVGQLPGPSGFGSTVSDRHGNIFYLGGGVSGRDIYKFVPSTNITTTVASLPYSVKYGVSIKVNASTVLILGGSGSPKELLSVNLGTLSVSRISNPLPFSVNHGAVARVGSKAFIFDDSSRRNRQAFEFDLESYTLQEVGPETLPLFFETAPSAVWNGRCVYVMGGSGYRNGSRGIIQFDPNTYANNFIALRDFQGEGFEYFEEAPASVYVPKTNRIYYFGGKSFNYMERRFFWHDQIFYVDLTPIDPTPIMPPSSTSTEVLSCSNRTDGLHPHPGDCSMFIGCQNEELTVFSCPFGLLFNSVTKGCDFPENVRCSTFCLDKSDGNYPHPTDCSNYIICRNGVKNVFNCPPPLLFNADKKHCYYPNLVSSFNSTTV